MSFLFGMLLGVSSIADESAPIVTQVRMALEAKNRNQLLALTGKELTEPLLTHLRIQTSPLFKLKIISIELAPFTDDDRDSFSAAFSLRDKMFRYKNDFSEKLDITIEQPNGKRTHMTLPVEKRGDKYFLAIPYDTGKSFQDFIKKNPSPTRER